MIRIVLTIEEEHKGNIRFKGAGEDIGGDPTHLEIDFAVRIMKAINDVKGGFEKSKSFIPLTFEITRKETHGD